MSAQRPVRTARSVGFVSALLLSTAIAAPAMAQIEEVIVTAQKRSEDIQTVPISITAFSSQDLKSHQVIQFKDLQFSTPSVSNTKGNFTGSNFQIRGIGITAVGFDSESGVAINFNDVFLAAPNIADAAFFDLERIEVLRGPQSTLYGRGATGGVVSVVAAKPDLGAFGADLEFTYGNFNQREVKGQVNIPIVTDQLGVRIAGDWIDHSGFTTNTFNNSHPDDRSQYSVRGSVRWEPTERTTVDFTAQFAKEDDNKMRSQKQLCHSDPSGVLGCLPDAVTGPAGANSVNPNATLGNTASSRQAFNALFGGFFGPAASNLGLFDLSVPPPSNTLGANPTDPRQIFTTFNPTYRSSDNFLSLQWRQSWFSWLESTFVGGYDRTSVISQQSFNNIPGITFDKATLANAVGTFNAFAGFLGLLNGNPNYTAPYQQFFTQIGAGQLPISTLANCGGTVDCGNGITGGNFRFTPEVTAFDQSNGESTQWSAEFRLNTKFDGPLNFMVAGYDLEQHADGNYFVSASTLDYPAIVVGGIAPPLTKFLHTIAPAFFNSAPTNSAAAAACIAKGCILAPSYFNAFGKTIVLRSRSLFGEVYYTPFPDTLTFTAGVRYNEDVKFLRNRTLLFNGFEPIGTKSEEIGANTEVAQHQTDFDCGNGSSLIPPTFLTAPGATVCDASGASAVGPDDAFEINKKAYRSYTGRGVANWTPKFDFTDRTLIYASYARGFKAGGFNPGIPTGLSVPRSYGPETIDAIEIGTKNTLLDNTLQANVDGWYYDYRGLQVSKIINNTSVNENINASLWGVEGEFFWAPLEGLQFNVNYGHTHSEIGNSGIVDPRNPTQGRANALLVKDFKIQGTAGENCVVYYNGAAPGTLPSGFFAPPGGVGALNGVGIPFSAYGDCTAPLPAGFSFQDPTDPKNDRDGVRANLRDNQLQNTPEDTVSVGAQYTQPFGDYNIVGRVDFYWQADMFGRIFNGPADKIDSWNVTNLSLTLNAPDNLWYIQGFVKNVGDNDNLTGEYLGSPTSGLFTNAFYEDPRTYGVRLGLHI